jgi:predicted amidohydrolase YtcJ
VPSGPSRGVAYGSCNGVVPILGDRTLTREQTLRLATSMNKWFVWEDDLGSIEAGNHADLAVLDRDYFTVPDEDIRRVRSVLTVVGGRIVHNDGVA